MSTGSTIHATRVALWGAIEALPGLDGVQKTYGPPDAYEEAEVVALLGVSDAEEEPAQLGANYQNERFVLTVRIKVHSPDGMTAQEVDYRCFALYDIVRGASGLSRTNMNLNGVVPGLQWCIPNVPSTEGVQPAQGGGWVIFIDLTFRCFARIAGP